MNWKKIKIGILIIFGLIILIPSFIYLSAIDWSKQHTKRVNALTVFDSSVNKGEYRLSANKMEFLIRVAGMQNDGAAIVLLHGFPESSLMWQPFLDSAAAKGYRVLAFDQRGYSPNARPKGKHAYHIDYLVGDVIAIANQVGLDTFHLVGHDWGAAVGWKTVMDFPERIHTWTAMSVPHIDVFFNGILNHPEQQKRSDYIFKLRKPYIPDFLFQVAQKRIAKQQEGIWTPEQIAEYSAIQREFGAPTALLNWYRAMPLEETSYVLNFQRNIARPTTFIWGIKDKYFAPSLFDLQGTYIDAPYNVVPLDSEHALIQTKTDSVLQAIFSNIEREI